MPSVTAGDRGTRGGGVDDSAMQFKFVVVAEMRFATRQCPAEQPILSL